MKEDVESSPGFRLAPAGPIDHIHARLRLSGEDPRRVVLRAIGTALLAWLPLLITSLMAREHATTEVSFFQDIAVHVRFLLVVPLLILAEASIGPRSHLVVCEFLSSGLIGEGDRPRFASTVQRGRRLVNSAVAEVLLIVGTIAVTLAASGVVAGDANVFWFERPGRDGATFTPAGFWYAFVASPIAVYLFLRWLWRYLVWSWFLRRVSRMQLDLSPAHPDRVGGLGFVSFHQSVFAILTLAAGCGAAAAAANRILYAGASLKEHQAAILAFGALSILVGVAPLISFTPVLVRLKRKGIFDYGRLANEYVQSFERKWVEPRTAGDEELLGSGDIQSLADMGGSFERTSSMRPMLIDRRLVVVFAFAALVPVVPLLLTIMPLKDIASLLLKIVI